MLDYIFSGASCKTQALTDQGFLPINSPLCLMVAPHTGAWIDTTVWLTQASSLNILINAISVWNTVYLSETIKVRRAKTDLMKIY